MKRVTALFLAILVAGCADEPPPPRDPAWLFGKSALIFFDSGSTVPKNPGAVDDLLVLYKQDARDSGRMPSVTVSGHADAVGGKEANHALSLQRAQAVADLLEQGGVPRDRITVSGNGDSQPLVVLLPQATAQERATALAMDRRVQVKTILNW